MNTIKMAITVHLTNENGEELDQETIVKAYYEMQYAVQDRIFGAKIFDKNIMVEEYYISDCHVE